MDLSNYSEKQLEDLIDQAHRELTARRKAGSLKDSGYLVAWMTAKSWAAMSNRWISEYEFREAWNQTPPYCGNRGSVAYQAVKKHKSTED